MRVITKFAKVDESACSGCGVCELVCPSEAIKIENRKSKINLDLCSGCMNCFVRCPEYAITMLPVSQPKTLFVDPKDFDKEKIKQICVKAHINPNQIACQCTNTSASEVVAAILKGAKTPTDVTRMTGVRTGCKEICVQNILRLLEAAGIQVPPAKGWQWYGRVPTVWDMPKEIRKKYQVYRMDDDIEFLDKVIATEV